MALSLYCYCDSKGGKICWESGLNNLTVKDKIPSGEVDAYYQQCDIGQVNFHSGKMQKPVSGSCDDYMKQHIKIQQCLARNSVSYYY